LEGVVAVAAAGKAVGDQFRAVGAAPAHVPRLQVVEPAPDQPAVNAEACEDLRHLAVVAEEIADEAGVGWLDAKAACDLAPEAKVADQRLAGDEKLIGQHIPWTDDKLARLRQPL